jgi:prolyl-tRNA synthetase
MFADMELIGIPNRVVIGDKGLDEGKLEYKGRRDAELSFVPIEEIVPFVAEKLHPGDG